MFRCSEGGGVSGGERRTRSQAELGWGMTREAVKRFFFVVMYYLIYLDGFFLIKKPHNHFLVHKCIGILMLKSKTEIQKISNLYYVRLNLLMSFGVFHGSRERGLNTAVNPYHPVGSNTK